MQVPVSTYRVQLSPAFTFEALEQIIDYLEKFHIQTVYAAPFFQAREGSMHGYDVIDPKRINPAIGDLEEFRQISAKLKSKGMGWLQDIVPNHMGYHPANSRIYSFLVHGPRSPYYRYFDINWACGEWEGRIMAPFLGADLESALRNGEFKLVFDDDGFSFEYFEHKYPASAPSYVFILKQGPAASTSNWAEKFESAPESPAAWAEIKEDLIESAKAYSSVQGGIKDAVTSINASERLMHQLMDLQFFQPVPWKISERKINFRRFFTVNDLICLRMEDQKVFDDYHTFILQLCREGLITGLRIDHVDGLFDPLGYLEALSRALGDDFYIVIEKILEWDEKLPTSWTIQGTSGYEYLAVVNNLFTDTQSEPRFTKEYQHWGPELPDYDRLVYDKKRFILTERMGGELQNLLDHLHVRNLLPGQANNGKRVKEAFIAFMSAFPVYRIYPKRFPLTNPEQKIIDEAHKKAKRIQPDLEHELALLKELFSGRADRPEEDMLYFLQRCQQFTGPLAAKGVEDTAFYNFNRLISHNEVGDSPGIFGVTVGEFHELMKERQENFPLAISASATHDTKRGEDARMRINVLSGIPEEWFQKVAEWRSINETVKKSKNIPDSNEEYFVYQTLLGAMPFEGPSADDFVKRTREYLRKVLREAKLHSSWSEPDEAYENELADFMENILKNPAFLASFDPFRSKVAFYGVLNSLGQSLVKVTAPGIPDIYQGTELWDLSYVDPDNRRPVDYGLRKKFLKEIAAFPERVDRDKLQRLMDNFPNGKIKMYTLYRALQERRENPEVFAKGTYVPLGISPDFSSKVAGFARYLDDHWYLTVFPVAVGLLAESGGFPLAPTIWADGYLELPESAPRDWINVYTGQTYTSNPTLGLSDLFSEFPVALLKVHRI